MVIGRRAAIVLVMAAASLACRGAAAADGGKQPQYGFRYDPMLLVESDRGLRGALVRTMVFRRTSPADNRTIHARFKEITDKQNRSGAFPDEQTAPSVIMLRRMGMATDSGVLRSAIDHIVRRERRKDGTLGVLQLQAACLADRRKHRKLIIASLRGMADEGNSLIGLGKVEPGMLVERIKTAWAGLDMTPVDAFAAKGLAWIADNLSPAGCLDNTDPWAYVDLAGIVDHPLGRKIVENQIPLILRGQRPDGGWGDRTVDVFRALEKYGLLEKLRKLPPLPSDWKVVRSIPAPAGGLLTMTWGGGRLWVYHPATHQAFALSPTDGKVLKKLRLPAGNVFGIGWWDGALAVTQNMPRRLLQVDPDTGKVKRSITLDERIRLVQSPAQVGGRIWIGDGFNGNVAVLDPARPDNFGRLVLAGPGPAMIAPAGRAVWHADSLARTIIKSDLSGKLLDWGENPFVGDLAGLAWDGKQLWAIDPDNNRICVIEKAAGGKGGLGWLSRGTSVTKDLTFAPADPTGSVKIKLRVAHTASLPAKINATFAPTEAFAPAPKGFNLNMPAGSQKLIDVQVGSFKPRADGDLPPLTLKWTAAYTVAGKPLRFARRRDLRILPKFACPRRKDKVVVDGNLAEWKVLPFDIVKPEQVLGNVDAYTGGDDCRFRFAVATDGSFLYIAVQVTDDKLFADRSKSIRRQDSVEVRLHPMRTFISSRSRGEGEYENLLPIVVAPGKAPADARVIRAGEMPIGSKVVSVTTKTGYNTEIAIPGRYLVARQRGSWWEFRLNVAVNDFDADGIGAQLWWKPDWRTPQTYDGSGTFRRDR